MDINSICTSKRKEFGKPCAFVYVESDIFEVDPNPTIRDEYIEISTVDRMTDNSVRMCEHEINTLTFPSDSRGMNHKEGGWPASVDNEDEESMSRFRKKVEKDKQYVNSIKSLSQSMEHFIMENTSVDIYEEYFENDSIKHDTQWSFSVYSIFQDMDGPHRSVVDMSWEKDSTKFAAIYSPLNSKISVMPSFHSYVWDVENNVQPLYVMKPDLPMTVVEFSPFNPNLILSGYLSGQIALWDTRSDGYPQQLASVLNSHNNNVRGIKWLKGKHDSAFFSGSSDGRLISWDCRDLSAPVEIINLDYAKDHIPNLKDTFAVSCVEYDASLPHQFMIGTQQGSILSFNRKYKEGEKKLHSIYECGTGPVLNVERNSFFPQLFLSCNIWSLKMWSDNVTDAPILTVASQDGYYTDTAWSPTRASTIFATKTNGWLEVWDLPGKIKEPLSKLKLEDGSLLSVAVAESGKHLLCGAYSGSIQLLSIPQHLQSSSETEKDHLRQCIKESQEIIGGEPRSERTCIEEETVEEWSDPLEKAEDLYKEEIKQSETSSGSIQLLSIPQHLQTSSESEKDELRQNIKENEEIIGGESRPDGINVEEIVEESSDPPEKAEDLHIEEMKQSETSSGSTQLLSIPEHLQNRSETEKDHLMQNIKENEEIIGGESRPDGINVEETVDESSDPSEKAEDLHIKEMKQSETSSGSTQLLSIPQHLQNSSETEKDHLRQNIKENEEIIDGESPPDGINMEEIVEESSDSPEETEDLHIEEDEQDNSKNDENVK